jgi:hypothetical protein
MGTMEYHKSFFRYMIIGGKWCTMYFL